MRKTLIIALLLLAGSFKAISQESIPYFKQKMEALEFMQGEWTGEGWIMGKDRQRHNFLQKETIIGKVNGSTLVVDGRGLRLDSSNKPTEEVVHSAYGVIYFDPEKNNYTMLSFSEINGKLEATMILTGEQKLEWSFIDSKSGGTIRFTEDFSSPGQWKETGEITMNGKDWYKFMEMTLTKN